MCALSFQAERGLVRSVIVACFRPNRDSQDESDFNGYRSFNKSRTELEAIILISWCR